MSENKNKPAIEAIIKGIKCDNVSCDYTDMTVLFEDYPLYINKPCPNCGSNLLTQEDFDMVIRLHKTVKDIAGELPPISQDQQEFAASVLFDGSGNIDMEIKPITKDDKS